MHAYLARSSSCSCYPSIVNQTLIQSIVAITIAIAHLLPVRYSQIRGLSIVIPQWFGSSCVVAPSAFSAIASL